MTDMTIETLKQICEKLPPEYKVKVVTLRDKTIPLSDTIEVDISNGTLILKE